MRFLAAQIIAIAPRSLIVFVFTGMFNRWGGYLPASFINRNS